MKELVKWSDIQEYINKVSILNRNKNISGVYGLPRGGLIFAVLLSHKMNIPLLQAPCKNCIIIDDISDTGESLLHYKNNSSGNEKYDYYITTMYYKQGSLVEPDYYFKKKEDNWIVYPWEVE